MQILKDFQKQQNRVLRARHSNSPRWERQRRRMVEQWLEFCGREYNLRNLKQLRQQHYDAYLCHLKRDGKSDKTIYKHSVVLRDFITAAHLPIQANPGKAQKRKTEKKKQVIQKILDDHGYELPDELLTKLAEVA